MSNVTRDSLHVNAAPSPAVFVVATKAHFVPPRSYAPFAHGLRWMRVTMAAAKAWP